MMEPTNSPLDRKSATALVERSIHAIDASTDDDRDMLLSDLLSAVWGTVVSQNQ